MLRKAYHAALCWLTLTGIPAATGKTVNNSIVDNVSAESAQRLYRNVPLGVYASAAPYAAYSFHLPAFISAPKPAASRIIPVKEQFILQNVNGYLKDSYGNKFVDTPQTTPYKNAFQQQYLPLQELPAHLSQPLHAAPQGKQAATHYFVGSPYRFPTFQVASHSPASSFGRFSQPFVFAQNFGGLASSQAAPTHSQEAHNQAQAVSTHAPAAPTQEQTTYTQTAPTYTQTAPTYTQTAPTYSQTAPSYAQTAPTHTQAITVQSSSNKAVYSDSKPVEHYNNHQNEVKFQRLEHRPEAHHTESVSSAETTYNEDKSQVRTTPAQTSVATVVNGKKTVITLDTKPLPLLDLSLLEPLTFANPLVPQVQHYLPRINEAIYHKYTDVIINEPKQHQKEIGGHKIKSYDSGNVKGKQRNDAPKKKPKQTSVQSDNHHKPRSSKPSIKVKGTPNKSPEFSYEINSPNYKETYKEQSISYNNADASDPVKYSYDKKTQSKPISYTYQKTEQKKPVHYNYVQSSKEPVMNKQIIYQGFGPVPRQLVFTFKPEGPIRKHEHVLSVDDSSAKDVRSSEVSGDDTPAYPQKYYNNQGHNKESSRPANNHEYYPHHQGHNFYHHSQNDGLRHYQTPNVISHRSNGNLHLVPNEEVHHEEHGDKSHNSEQSEAEGSAQYHPTKEYNEDIRIVPSQVTNDEFVKQIDSYQNLHPSPLSTLKEYQKFVEQQTQTESTPQHSSAAPFVHETAKRIIIQEETPEEMHSHHEQIKSEKIDQDDNNEEEFEKAYKNAAFGFAAFENKAEDIEKDIYSPNNYGYTQDKVGFDVEKTPFQEYQADGDSFPKSSRANYKDARDSTMEDYYLDYSINKPESLADRYQNKANYFKLYKSNKPEKYFAGDQNKKSEKYSVAPSFDFRAAPEKKQNFFAQYKTEPIQYEYNYEKEAPRDSSAHASRPYQKLKSKTNFVEPQFQYGFEPLGLPRLLDSELAAMASNDSPESEKPGMRKKIYKENWYIKKTSTSGGEPS